MLDSRFDFDATYKILRLFFKESYCNCKNHPLIKGSKAKK